MSDKMQQAIEMSQQEVITAAETKLGRKLTDSERIGVQRIRSLMMLESCFRSFSSPAISGSQVLADLQSFEKLS